MLIGQVRFSDIMPCSRKRVKQEVVSKCLFLPNLSIRLKFLPSLTLHKIGCFEAVLIDKHYPRRFLVLLKNKLQL